MGKLTNEMKDKIKTILLSIFVLLFDVLIIFAIVYMCRVAINGWSPILFSLVYIVLVIPFHYPIILQWKVYAKQRKQKKNEVL